MCLASAKPIFYKLPLALASGEELEKFRSALAECFCWAKALFILSN
jgi:hypothetical protein